MKNLFIFTVLLSSKFPFSASLKCDKNTNQVYKGEERLRRNLLCNYNVAERPVSEFTQQVVVNMSGGISNYEFVRK
jgi:hypothetical protein